MRPISSHSRPAAPFWCRRFTTPRAVATGLSAAALIAVAACGSSTVGGSGGSSLTPRQALSLAASQNQHLTSAVETLTVQVTGAQRETTTGTILIQRNPALEISANLTAAAAGRNVQIKEVLTSQAIYFSAPGLTGQLTKKPWVKIPLSALKTGTAAGASFAQLFHSLESNNFTNQTEILAVAKNAHLVGKQTVNGVPTTEYAGSITASQALRALSASFRKSMGSFLRALGNATINFHIWIDGQNQTRRLAETESLNGATVNTTVNITGINQPVHITVPPASQITQIPGL
jgi:hypothetical protein